MFEKFQRAVERTLQRFTIKDTTQFTQLVRDELSDISPDIHQSSPNARQLHTLYELRARFLDWELGTGYLGFFSRNPGTRYTFTRRLEVVFQMLPSLERVKILEIGCGAGLFCLESARQATTVIGIDISLFVLDFARQVKDEVHSQNVSFQQGDAEQLAFRDETFDLVICSEVLEHVPDPQRALAEIRRVTKPGGTVILTTPSAVSLSDLFMGLFRVFNKHIESEKDVHFDKKTYLAMQRINREQSENIDNTIFVRIHERFSFPALLTMFHQAGLNVEQAHGTVFAFPPHYQIFYRYCPGWALPAIRLLEQVLNRVHIFQRWGSVTTCFTLKAGPTE